MSNWRKPTRLTSWSVSRYQDWFRCPAFAKYKHIDKLKEPGNAAMDRGTVIHKEAENFLKGVAPLTTALKKFSDEFKFYKQYGAPAEVDWTFRADWTQTTWNDWDEAWVRVKLDTNLLFDDGSLSVVDFKTGQVRDNKLQMELYAVSGFTVYPNITQVDTSLWFLDAGEKIEETYPRSAYPTLRKEWETRVKPMLADTTFKPKPGNHCRWCFYRKSNGGPCMY